MPSADQFKKLPLIQFPVSVLCFLVRIENLRRRRELWEMHVLDIADCFREIAQVIFFAKPASCETLLSRTSTKRLTPESFSFGKKVSADFLVKPIVKSFIRPNPSLSPFRAQELHRQFVRPARGKHSPTILRGNETCHVRANSA